MMESALRSRGIEQGRDNGHGSPQIVSLQNNSRTQKGERKEVERPPIVDFGTRGTDSLKLLHFLHIHFLFFAQVAVAVPTFFCQHHLRIHIPGHNLDH